MKRIITTFFTFLILASFSSICLADELEIKTREDCLQVLQEKETEIERLQRKLVEKEAEIERLRNLCSKHGINTIEKEITTPKGDEEIKALGDPIFGIRLGVDLVYTKGQYVCTPSDSGFYGVKFNDNYPAYRYNSTLPSVALSGFVGIENKIGVIIVFLSDSSKSNFLAVIKEIESKYQVLTREVISGDQIRFLVSIDGEDVTIEVERKMGFMKADKLSLIYYYNKLVNLSQQHLIDQKGTEIKKQL